MVLNDSKAQKKKRPYRSPQVQSAPLLVAKLFCTSPPFTYECPDSHTCVEDPGDC